METKSDPKRNYLNHVKRRMYRRSKDGNPLSFEEQTKLDKMVDRLFDLPEDLNQRIRNQYSVTDYYKKGRSVLDYISDVNLEITRCVVDHTDGELFEEPLEKSKSTKDKPVKTKSKPKKSETNTTMIRIDQHVYDKVRRKAEEYNQKVGVFVSVLLEIASDRIEDDIDEISTRIFRKRTNK